VRNTSIACFLSYVESEKKDMKVEQRLLEKRKETKGHGEGEQGRIVGG
jgi:hypothetical protein